MKKKWVIIISALLAAAALITAGIFLFLMPYVRAESRMNTEGGLILRQNADGSVELSWPESEADYYHVSLVILPEAEGGEEQLLQEADVMRGTSYVLPRLYQEHTVTVRVNTMVRYRFPGMERVRAGSAPLETVLNLTPPAVTDLEWTADPDADILTLRFSMTEGDLVRLYQVNGQGEKVLLKTLSEGNATVTFGDGKELALPEHGHDCLFAMDSYREQPGSVYYGKETGSVTVSREDFLGIRLLVESALTDENQYTLTWNETKGQEYLVQMLRQNADQWETLCTVDQAGDRTYTTPHLEAFSRYDFRVVAVGGQTMPGSEIAALSEKLTVETAQSLLYSTIWPLKKLDVYAQPGDEEAIGSVAAGSAHCVLEEKEGMFRIRYGTGYGYIDSNQCLINLPEYLGDLCAYNITNSYQSIYKIHKYDIPDVTDEVTKGYEKVRLRDGSYLVPLLYPTAQKLMNAAIAAQAQGYRLKIYDAFRPNKATISIYDLTEKILEDPVPGNVRDPSKDEPDRLLTYEKAMTNEKYALNYFLARGMSMHNVGVAVDITIEDLSTGREQYMQTAMHDLSHHSVLYKNNGNANILAGIMKGAGFGDLISEWWHFQDNEAYKELNPAVLYGGVSAQCWVKDDTGWRWRYDNGTFAANTYLTIDGVEYAFDEAGYLRE